MSHFSVCVALPADTDVRNSSIWNDLEGVLEPYYEATENPAFLEFQDKTEQAKKEYQTDTARAVRMWNGGVVSISDPLFNEFYLIDGGKVYLKNKDDRNARDEDDKTRAMEIIDKYPVKELYTFESYCESYCGYSQNSKGAWGYYCNPNATWDWYEIGGRFSGKFLVREGLEECVRGSRESEIPEYIFADAARKKDICWEKMKELSREAACTYYERLKAAFQSKETKDLGPFMRIAEEGIVSWNNTLEYVKDESLDEFLTRKGATGEDAYLITPYAIVDLDGKWHARGTMGWFGYSSGDMPERDWHDQIQSLIGELADDTVMVMVDCHI